MLIRNKRSGKVWGSLQWSSSLGTTCSQESVRKGHASLSILPYYGTELCRELVHQIIRPSKFKFRHRHPRRQTHYLSTSWNHTSIGEDLFFDIRHSRYQRLSRRKEVKLEEAYSSLSRIMFQRVRTAGWVLLGNLPKIHSQDFSSFLYANKRCSSSCDHGICLLLLERPYSAFPGPK